MTAVVQRLVPDFVDGHPNPYPSRPVPCSPETVFVGRGVGQGGMVRFYTALTVTCVAGAAAGSVASIVGGGWAARSVSAAAVSVVAAAVSSTLFRLVETQAAAFSVGVFLIVGFLVLLLPVAMGLV